MLRVQHFSRRIAVAIGAALVFLCPLNAPAAPSIDLSLNVLYANPANINSGGTWELVAKTNVDGFGLFGLSALLTNTTTAQGTAPRGFVNATDPAGLSIFANTVDPDGFRNLTFGQIPLVPSATGGKEQSVFYGIGTLVNGAPNYPGKPAGTNSIGPALSSLTNVNGVPWAATNTFGNPAWATAAKLAMGTFAPGVTPAFFANANEVSRGHVFTALGTSVNYGQTTEVPVIANTIVRTNFSVPSSSADYNHNGVVDAADYIVWRKTLGSTTLLDADGNGNGSIDDGDYSVWRAKFGTIPGAGAGSTLAFQAVPEPCSAILLVFGATVASCRLRRAGRPENPRPARQQG